MKLYGVINVEKINNKIIFRGTVLNNKNNQKLFEENYLCSLNSN